MHLYENPFYYDIAFSFRDIGKEVDFFKQCIDKFSKIKVKQVLEMGCGPSPYIIGLSKLGYSFTGLDKSEEMLGYSLEKAHKAGINIKIIHADMRNFRSIEKFDFAFCMLGSIHAESNKDFLLHLTSMSNCLKKGGLYLIDACCRFNWLRVGGENWTVLKGGLTVNVTYEENVLNMVEQKTLGRITVEVIENGKTKVLQEETISKVIFPQEFLELVDKNGKFEFVGWYNNFDLDQPLELATKVNRPITILRRK
jgi:SAM-dependent methyltransferase